MNTTNVPTMITNVPTMIMMPLHTEVGMDMLWISTWMPTTVGSTFGASVGLFFLAIFYRFALAFIATNTIRNALRDNLAKNPEKTLSGSQGIQYPPFSFKTDATSGLLELLTSFVGYLLMLAVMLQNAWFFIAVLLGIGVGETAFGRFKRSGPWPGAYVEGSVHC